MTAPELQVLALAGLLQAGQYVWLSVRANRELGFGRTLGPRDPQRLGAPLEALASPRTGRLYRALNNHFEGLILFTLAVVVLILGDKTTGLSGLLAWTYLAARVLYVPAYYFGLRPWRSLIWLVGFCATIAMIGLALV
ncbi:MAG: MAPEG family protein [Limimaricola soesokkakensis]|uniref:MAPEG family protein n=1 Tax=Limimaricola soesokkakensis TaxID=1343159 RepID=A0A1X6ZLJ9_9RHOB|nr:MULTISPECIES: MAPEG family protein [Limimaricola]MCZ4261710.1 MAPEG family protein [Limimaricola sp. G21655-S1]PSK84916.1 putative MAPEG superfamily protein [Limimaricola soesokkakensis]SLN52939.1 MAPEG family protein [Limimaricola soesokkakensis]